MAEVETNAQQNTGKISESEWNQRVDNLVEKLNKHRGILVIPPSTHTLSNNEYERNILNRSVTEDLIRHFANAVGDPNPLWRDLNYARGTRWGGIIAPPCFEYCIADCDGAGVGPHGSFLMPGFNLFAAGDRHEYFGVIRPGDEFRIVDKYLGVDEKPIKGRAYRLFIESGLRSYINQRDEVVAIATGRRVMTGTPPGHMDKTQDQIYKTIKRHHYTQDELDIIHKHYNDELGGKFRRGKEVRYWEDVVEGENLTTLIKGPLDMSDACSAMLVEYNGSFAVKWAVMRDEIENYPIDPETGEYHFRRDWHFMDSIAQVSGVPYAFQIGKFSEMVLTHVVTNWMGDDGFVKMLDFQLRHINIMGDMNWLKGKVTKKYIVEKEYLVDLDIWSENQNGTLITKGNTTVRLISKSD